LKKEISSESFSESELRKIIKMTGKKPVELLRKRDKMYKHLELEKNKKQMNRSSN
jgi:arsenate reductase